MVHSTSTKHKHNRLGTKVWATLVIGIFTLITNFSLNKTLKSFNSHGVYLKDSQASNFRSELSGPSHQMMVVPFNAYEIGKDVMEHRTCKKTTVIEGKTKEVLQWADLPFEELELKDMIEIDLQKNDDMLCLQVSSSVRALVLSIKKDSTNVFQLVSSDETDKIIAQLKEYLSKKAGGEEIEYKVVNRKLIAMSGWYKPFSPDVREKRSRDDNSGNFIWQFGATRLINPYTVKFESPATKLPVSALVVASANALYLPTEDKVYQIRKNHINRLTSIVRSIDQPTIVLGIGIQANFGDIEDTKGIKLHEHQVTFMNEIAMRSTGKSVSVRGDFTETACVNAGVKNCISLGCPSLTISRAPDLGQVLETKWNNVVAKLASEHTLKVGIALPALQHSTDMYSKVVDMLLLVCKSHDCYFIAQAPNDKPLLLKHAKGKVDQEKILHFREGVESWFKFIRSLDFVVSTRIHGGMAGIANDIPTIIVPTDFRILELVNAMKLPHISFEDATNRDYESLFDLITAAKKDFREFERKRRDHLKEYKRILESAGLEMDPALLDIILN